MSSVRAILGFVLVFIVFDSFVLFGQADGVFDKIKAGFRYANDYLETVKEVANLVAKSLNPKRKESQNRGDRAGDHTDRDFGTSNIVSAFFRLLGLDSQKVAAITVNSAIFLAQMISSLFELPAVKNDKFDQATDDVETPWDPLQFILKNKNEKMKKLIEEARNEALPDRLLDSLDGFDSGCIRLLLCKISIVIRAAQESLKNKKPNSNGIRSFTAWLPSREDFEGNSDECEDKYTDCRLFPES
ncbi:hypothetical protein KPH14_004784 [Odynerus spinipes]|uniref:Uncharacterized protein n=1 Tax=Odynerus spinipes TaxID=1348599 RepID=A0AAD9RMH4_9HYME|nr:hypothetical protein KPH14_004784 [Odynerus spinipes]